jgi:molybdenum cofactor cytidylyltransferase
MQKDQVGIIILAAGSSSRLGRAKQLVRLGGQSLIDKIIEESVKSLAFKVWLVVGANQEAILRDVKTDEKLTILNNDDWEEGMASSIRLGISNLMNFIPKMEAALILLVDQPFVTSHCINEVIAQYLKTNSPIVISDYGNNTLGPPILFHQSVFEELLELKGDMGAKKIIASGSYPFVKVDFQMGKYDIDTDEGLEEVKALWNRIS